MDLQRTLLTPQDRIAWAIDRCKKQGVTPEALAAKVGLSRPGMLHWTKETTEIDKVGVGFLSAFALAAGVNLDWILHGIGQPLKTYTPSAEATALALALDELASHDPAEYRVLARMIHASTSDRLDAKRPDDSPKTRPNQV